jgi:hypothetical protein
LPSPPGCWSSLNREREKIMDEKPFYDEEDCTHIGYDMSIAGKVVVLKLSALPDNLRSGINQLCLCTGGNPNPIGRSVSPFPSLTANTSAGTGATFLAC